MTCRACLVRLWVTLFLSRPTCWNFTWLSHFAKSFASFIRKPNGAKFDTWSVRPLMTMLESPLKIILSRPIYAASSIACVAARAFISPTELANWTFWARAAIARPWLSQIITPRLALPLSWEIAVSKLALYQSGGGGDHLACCLTVGAAIIRLGCADRYSNKASYTHCTIRFRGKLGKAVLTLFLQYQIVQIYIANNSTPHPNSKM